MSSFLCEQFHCDEALAVAMLKFLPKWKDAAVVRSRDPEVLAGCDIVGAITLFPAFYLIECAC